MIENGGFLILKMMMMMKLNNWMAWPLKKYINLLLKVATLLFFLGLGFILLSRSSTPATLDRVEIEKTPLFDVVIDDSIAMAVSSASSDDSSLPGQEKCDLFTGEWIPNPSGPVYTNESCTFIEEHQNCMKNGRPDSGYLYWRWKPHKCELPPFDARKFLELMRNKSLALIGDSISQNHVQSMLCMLAPVEKPIQVYRDEQNKSKTWNFPSHNFNIHVIWSPFLFKATIFEDINGVSTSEVELHLDELDPKWTEPYPNLHYVIISSGKWFQKPAVYYENKTLIGCHNCDEKRNLTTIGYDYAYQKTLERAMRFITTTPHKGSVFFRTSTPHHFEFGKWNTGGNCPKTEPDTEIELNELSRTLRNTELMEFEKAAGVAKGNGVDLRLIDLSSMMLKRPDGHPGRYRHFHPSSAENVQNDCMHWCLPGPMDYWNDVIMEMVVNGR